MRLLTFILLLSNSIFSQNINSKVTISSLKRITNSEQYILDTVFCDLNNDKIKDIVLVLELNKFHHENSQHQSPLPILLLIGEVGNNYNLWKRNEKIIEKLGDNCPADGYQNIVHKGVFFTIESTVCRDKYYQTQFATFKY